MLYVFHWLLLQQRIIMVPDYCFDVAVVARPRSSLSSRPLHYMYMMYVDCIGSSLAYLYIVLFSANHLSSLLSYKFFALEWLLLALPLLHIVRSHSFYVHLKTVPFSREMIGITPE